LIVLNELKKDKIVAEVCKKLQFAESPSEQTFLNIIDIPSFILEKIKSSESLSDFVGTYSFNLLNCPVWNDNQFSIQIDKKSVSIQKGKLFKPEVTVTIDFKTFAELVFNPKKSDIFFSKVQINPWWKMRKFQKFLNQLKIDSPWFTPKADIG
jgi:hypothetical protein